MFLLTLCARSLTRYLASHVDQLGSLSNCTMRDLGMGLHRVETVPPETSALEAVAIMKDKVS